MISAHLLDPTRIAWLQGPLDDDGNLRIMPASYYAETTREERAMLGHLQGAYVLPTHELIALLSQLIGNRSAIEVGAGNGLIARELRIPGTDNFLQRDNPEVAAYYAKARQPLTRYGADVHPLDAEKAITVFRPSVVVACWLTSKYDPAFHSRGGSVYGPDERAMLAQISEYVFVGNTGAHRHKAELLGPPAWMIQAPHGLYSRAMMGTDFIAGWKGAA